MVDHARARRLAVRIRDIVADALERQVKDPRLGMVTVTDARVTPDLREATVFWTVLGDEQDAAASAAALESACGVVRATVGRQTGIRYTPSITFVRDRVPDQAATIDALVAKARAQDAALEASRVGKDYVAGPNAYRLPHDAEAPEDHDGVGPAEIVEATGTANR